MANQRNFIPKYLTEYAEFGKLKTVRVAKTRKVLQNGMSFANERLRPAVSLRVRYYFYKALKGKFSFGVKILSVSLNFNLGDFFNGKFTCCRL